MICSILTAMHAQNTQSEGEEVVSVMPCELILSMLGCQRRVPVRLCIHHMNIT